MMYDDEIIIPLKVLMRRIKDCKDIYKIEFNPTTFYDIRDNAVYSMNIKTEAKSSLVSLNIWMYFYDEDNVMLQQVWSEEEDIIPSVNKFNDSNRELHFKSVEHKATEEEMKYYERKLTEYDW